MRKPSAFRQWEEQPNIFMENYIVINGKKAELTDEQLRQLGIEVKSNPFDRQSKKKLYYFIGEFSDVDDAIEEGMWHDDHKDKVVNYFNDKDFAEQVMLHQLLYRKLLKYSYDNDAEDCEWDGQNIHYPICYDKTNGGAVDRAYRYKMQGTVYFSKEDAAEEAIKDVIEPFMKEYPNFEW